MAFNFDLNNIETLLSQTIVNATVGFASDFNHVREHAVHSAQLFVLPLADDNTNTNEVHGLDEYQIKDVFAVMIVIPCSAGNAHSDMQIKQLRSDVKTALAGCQFAGWNPIKLDKGRTIELSKQTNNLIYQCQFSVTGLHTVTVKVMP